MKTRTEHWAEMGKTRRALLLMGFIVTSPVCVVLALIAACREVWLFLTETK